MKIKASILTAPFAMAYALLILCVMLLVLCAARLRGRAYFYRVVAGCGLMLCTSLAFGQPSALVVVSGGVRPATGLGCTPPVGYAPVSYLWLHGTQPGVLSPLASTTNGCLSFNGLPPFAIGANYFTVAAFELTNGALLMSSFSNEVVLTNYAGLALNQMILSSTNLGGGWMPWSTNTTYLLPTEPQRFFKPGGMGVRNTNLMLPPIP